ncbi:MAG: DUF4402 domain-containing protein [Prolixibacteraceae bacterium]|jgi:hypothetical protein|nr:DUF4402 domain-containing protein [Prolixibacteraceae bacterium]
MKKLFILFIAVVGFGVSSYGQVSATATSAATIVTPISITKTVNMNFGNVSVNANAGTVVLTPAGTRSVTGGATTPATVGTVTAASFDIAGAINYTYTITLPAAATTLKHTNNTDQMTVDTWTSSPTPTGTLDGTGAQTLTVGATLNVGASQLAGVYTSTAPFTVTVNYN